MSAQDGDPRPSPLTEAAQLLVMLSLLPEDHQQAALDSCKGVLRGYADEKSGRIEVLSNMVAGLHREIHTSISLEAPPLIRSVSECIRERLLVHHATKEQGLERREFEEAIGSAARQQGIALDWPQSKTQARWDVSVATNPPERWSLKTESADHVKDATISVSKLTEARWVQTAGMALPQMLQDYVRAYIAEVQRLLVLRRFAGPSAALVYQLVEIPVTLLRPVATATSQSLAQQLANSKTLQVVLPGAMYSPTVSRDPVDAEPLIEIPDLNRTSGTPTRKPVRSGTFSLGLDMSDGKIKLERVPLSACEVHAIWTLLPL
jgi:hypothetical protein